MSNVQRLEIANLASMQDFAVNFAQQLAPGDVVFLEGNLGAGKTTFTRFLLAALGYNGIVKSPTYSIVESYDVAKASLHHFDLYRIEGEAELEAMGLRDFFNTNDICIIEWPDRLDGSIKPDWLLQLAAGASEEARIITITKM